MRRIILALVASVLAAGVFNAGAAADSSPPGATSQTAGQAATSTQHAGAAASSGQIAPTNTNVAVRVLSPGSNGPVSQSNTSSAGALAANANLTGQSVDQTGAGLQQAGQLASNAQGAAALADSAQVKPQNTNVDVRVLSPGGSGPVAQENTSSATAIAANLNATGQDVTQAAGPGASQTAGQAAASKQGALAAAESVQLEPTNTNVSVRVLSPGYDGPVSQSNDSDATAAALNGNLTSQGITQLAGRGGPASQTAGQAAGNLQGAAATAASAQVKPTNTAASTPVLGGGGGAVDQSNSSEATGVAANLNATSQDIEQLAGGGSAVCCVPHGGGIGVQAAGQQAGNVQSAEVCCAQSLQVHPSNTAVGGSGPTTQANTSSATGIAANLNGLEQSIGQRSGFAPAPAPLKASVAGGPVADSAPTAAAPAPAGVSQSNASQAGALSANLNKTGQTITQQQGHTPGLGIQAAGQLAGNVQHADAAAESIQVHPTNTIGHAGGWDGRCETRCEPKPSPCTRDRCGDPCLRDRCRPAPPTCGSDRYSPRGSDRCAPAPRRCEPVSLGSCWKCCPARHPERGPVSLE